MGAFSHGLRTATCALGAVAAVMVITVFADRASRRRAMSVRTNGEHCFFALAVAAA
jgi:hypothetical protein